MASHLKNHLSGITPSVLFVACFLGIIISRWELQQVWLYPSGVAPINATLGGNINKRLFLTTTTTTTMLSRTRRHTSASAFFMPLRLGPSAQVGGIEWVGWPVWVWSGLGLFIIAHQWAPQPPFWWKLRAVAASCCRANERG